MNDYQPVIGLETHFELATDRKLFCGCKAAFGAPQNTQVCPICMGVPGTLPVLNPQAAELAVVAGLALDCAVAPSSRFARKNYFYPDLPKAYQMTQLAQPICADGFLTLESGKRIRIVRIQLEEDAGKLTHTADGVQVDYNRCGVPLIEVVTAPDFCDAAEVREYLERLRLLMRYVGVSDCKMQEGSLRCDVNISLCKVGAVALGERAELKNLNSFAAVGKAIHYEIQRQSALLAAGERVARETRRFDVATGKTERLRGKEDAGAYRYLREPDLPPLILPPALLARLRATLPELPDAKLARYRALGLPTADAALLVRYPAIADYFDRVAVGLQNPTVAARLVVGQLFSRMPTDEAKQACAVRVTAPMLRSLCLLLESGKLRVSLAKATLETMLDSGKAVEELLDMATLAATQAHDLPRICAAAIEQNPKAVADYRRGKTNALMALLGAVMRTTGGGADAHAAQAQLELLLQ